MPGAFQATRNDKTPVSINHTAESPYSQRQPVISTSSLSQSSMEASPPEEYGPGEYFYNGSYHNKGVLRPAGSAQYNFLMQKLKYRKELRRENA